MLKDSVSMRACLAAVLFFAAAPALGAPTKSWKEIDALVSNQKMQEALTATEARLSAGRNGADETEWTRALIRVVQLRTSLHGYETSVRFLREEPWPKGPLARASLELFYAAALKNYMHVYSWEIRGREKVESKGAVDLKAWTMEQLQVEAGKALQRIWATRDQLGARPIRELSEYVQPNSYPAEIRGTLRDLVAYTWVDALNDSSQWRPEHANELYRLDFKALVAGGGTAAVDLASPEVHPLQRVGALLDDLEAWHRERKEQEAALEARLARLRVLHAHFTGEDERTVLRVDLAARLESAAQLGWWSMGKSLLGEMWRDIGNQVRAHAQARECVQRGQGVGKARCEYLQKSIEAPDYQLESMATDGAQRRSITVNHRNLPELYFRAYPVDLLAHLERSNDYSLLPDQNEIRPLLDKAPAQAWKVSLPATPDYATHRTHVTPPLKAPGLYVVIVSASPTFTRNGNRLLAVNFIVTDLVVVSRTTPEAAIEAQVLSGSTGAPVEGAEVLLYRFDYQRHHQAAATQRSDRAGFVRFDQKSLANSSYFLLARKGDQVTLDQQGIYLYRAPQPTEVVASLVYTDRSIYRPLQKIMWKALAYRGSPGRDRYQVVAGTELEVALVDANNQVVEKKKVKANAFGSASGEFVVPSGRMLGTWRLRASPSGSATVRVEEYKRPTFEATLDEPAGALRLNQPATLKGKARYYFGLPVTAGSVRWRVTREPRYPWWWFRGWYGNVATGAVQLATGTSRLEDDGSFTVAFTPAADSKQKKPEAISYFYNVTADVTDEGGETRTATRGFRIGFVSIESALVAERAFFREGEGGSVRVVRTDLNGAPRSGTGTWRLLGVQQPATTPLPADVPVRLPPREGVAFEGVPQVVTDGDRLPSRHAAPYDPMALVGQWPDGDEKARGTLHHDAKGEATVTLPSLPPGAYRLRYETADESGAKHENYRDLLVAGERGALAVPAMLSIDRSSAKVGDKINLFARSGLSNQPMVLEFFRAGRMTQRRLLDASKDSSLIELPITEADRGGFAATLHVVRDHQLMTSTVSVFVPWDDKELKVDFATFRDKVRPGAKETWKVTVKGPGGKAEAGTAELLAYMYDQALDLFAPHMPPSVTALYPNRAQAAHGRSSLAAASVQWLAERDMVTLPSYPQLTGDRLKFFDGYGIGGMGYRRGGPMRARHAGPSGGMPGAAVAEEADQEMSKDEAPRLERGDAPAPPPAAAPAKAALAKNALGEPASAPAQAPSGPVAVRSNFSETAFFQPHLLTAADGSASIEFAVPDSVTSWNVWVHAVTRDLRGGQRQAKTQSVKDLMVRPYVPRFLREGDQAELKVVVNNASDHELSGALELSLEDSQTGASVASELGVSAADAKRPLKIAAGKSQSLSFHVTAPKRVGQISVRAVARAGNLSDGELRAVPILPSRMHLVQSRFVTLRDKDSRTMTFADLAKNDDPTRLDEQLVVTVDAQLFYSALDALPYLINYPYECTEQTMNRFVSTGILSSMYGKYPAVAKMAQKMSQRTSPLEAWGGDDPNRKMALEETPWVQEAKGGNDAGLGMVNVLDPRITQAEREASLAKLRKAQTSSGGFPWFPGGPPSPYITLYLMHGFAKASEFGVPIPKDVTQRGWAFLARHYREEYAQRMIRDDCCWEFLTFLNYVASSYPDDSYTGGALTAEDRKRILDFSYRHWKQHSPFWKGYLALTLKRMGRQDDGRKVFASVMDSSKTTQDEGTFWAAEDRSWLWYKDTIETHAFALRTLLELEPSDARRHGLVQWLLLNKKLGHWKSTRATAEVLYALVKYLDQEHALGIREDATVVVGPKRVTMAFSPDEYTGKKNQVIIPGRELDPKTQSTVTVSKLSKGFAFASATWHFSTDKLPEEDRGDFFKVSRAYFKRVRSGREVVLRPIKEGEPLVVGDQLEVQLSLRSKHAAEYVHLRDPRGAGLEPEGGVSRYKWDLGIYWYEEIRDSGTNFFFESLPVGEYTFKYRLRANMAGTFRVGPATVQSMYAPEFAAYSTGALLGIGAAP